MHGFMEGAARAMHEDRAKMHQLTMWALLSVGCCLVLFANAFGLGYATGRSGTGFVAHEAVRDAAESFRWIGLLLFSAGLAERILIRLDR